MNACLGSPEERQDQPPSLAPRRPRSGWRALRDMALTLLIGSAGGTAFFLAGAPAAFLTGAAVGVIAAVVAGLPLALPGAVRSTSFAILGIMMGAAVSPDALSELGRAPVALVGLVLVVVGATAAGYQVLRRVGGWDPMSALCGSIPGSFALVMAMAGDSGARMERVVMAQATRLFILVALVPFAIGGPAATGLRTTAPADYDALDVVLTLAAAAGAALIAVVLKIPGGALIGPLVASVALSLSGTLTIAVPAWLAAAAFVVLGASIAVRFDTVQRAGLRRMLAASLMSFLAAFTVALAGAALFAALLDLPFGVMFLAFAPGGLDAMVALSFLLHSEVAFVAVLHTGRLLLLGFSVPALLAWWGRRAAASSRAAP